MTLLIILVVLILVFGGGSHYYGGGQYRNYGYGGGEPVEDLAHAILDRGGKGYFHAYLPD